MFNKIYWIALLYMIIFWSSCHRDCPAPMPTDCVPHEVITFQDTGFYVWTSGKEKDGFATAIKLNKEWRASAGGYRFNDQIFVLYFETYNYKDDFEIKKETIYFRSSVFQQTKCINLINDRDSTNCEVEYRVVEDDKLEDSYKVNESLNESFIEIDTLDLNIKRFSGRFKVYFNKTSNNRPWNLPTVRFFNGEFHCNIVN
ncbi:MAG: hypothetical protein U0T81_03905 [Saprospiraceae bacterium]